MTDTRSVRRHRPALWNSVRRTVLPTYGARANAADGLRDAQRNRLDRAIAARAMDEAGYSLDGQTPAR